MLWCRIEKDLRIDHESKLRRKDDALQLKAKEMEEIENKLVSAKDELEKEALANRELLNRLREAEEQQQKVIKVLIQLFS